MTRDRDRPYLEPHADVKSTAASIRQIYNAFIEVGFDHDSAMAFTERWFEDIMIRTRS